MSQNIFDNEVFFLEYKKLRGQNTNYNDLLEQPAMRKLLPDLCGKQVLDIGCGFGHNCAGFMRAGAKSAVGIDLSEKMLAVARAENTLPGIQYLRMDMAQISDLKMRFDLIYSSLAFHYAEDFQKLARDIYGLLCRGGQLLFSQEHPFVTASKTEAYGYIYNSEEEAAAYAFSDYMQSGRRCGAWFVEDVENFHRPFGMLLTALCDAGFLIEKVVEPIPSEEACRQRPGLKKEFIKPTFLIVRARKQ